MMLNVISGQLEAILFDFDGVLRDVSKSYRLAISKTVGVLSEALKSKKEDATFEEIEKYKSQGFNNDWDCTEQILIHERRLDVSKEVIVNTFQDFYLGNQVPDNSPIGYKYTGFIESEKFMADLNLLKQLSEQYFLAIISGAPREEVEYALKKVDVNSLNYFNNILCMEDLESRYSNSKALAIKEIIQYLNPKSACYVGDATSDMKAAKEAAIVGIGVIPAGVYDENPQGKLEWEQKLKDASALRVFENIDEVMSFFVSRKLIQLKY